MIDPFQPDFSNTPASQLRPSYGYAPEDIAATPYVSIVTPFHDTGEAFRETTLSILGQSYQQWEWLIVNDASTDPTALKLLDYIRHLDPRIRVIDHNENMGPSAARNTGFHAAVGSYFVNVDSDDLLEPTAIEKWLWYLETHPLRAFVKGYSISFDGQQYLSARGFEEGEAFLQDNLLNPTVMIRREVIEKTGGFDTDLRTGLEDWDFWLKAANVGQWGGTVPEYLDWYRRRPSHSDRWSSWNPAGIKRFRRLAKQRYPRLWMKNGFPSVQDEASAPFSVNDSPLAFHNRLIKRKPRALFIIPWMELGGADRVNIDWIASLIDHGYEVSVCATLKATQRWAARFTALTPDVFVLPHFLALADIPRFLVYLIRSRNVDIVFLTNSTLGYLLLPFLRSRCPHVVYVDINHVEEPHWLNGGHPRFGVGYQDLLDLNITTTAHLRDWMIGRGADGQRISVCYTGAASRILARSSMFRTRGREDLKLVGDITCIVFAGRLCAQKRPLMVVEILQRLKERGLPFQCIFIGDGELHANVEKSIRRNDLKDSVTFTGSVDHETCLNYFAAADILLLPSAYEGISVALYEAMASGIVPVVSKVGGHEEVIVGNEGFLIPHGANEVEDYVEKLERLISDPSLKSEMTQAARKRIADFFTAERGVEALLAAIRHAHHLSQALPRHTPPPGFALETASLAIEYTRLTAQSAGSSRLVRLLEKLRRRKLGKVLVDNWITKTIVKQFGHTALLRKLRSK